MPEFERIGNILLVSGSDLFDTGGDYRDKLRDFLYDDSTGEKPVSEGSHDFWLVYSMPAEQGPEHTREDMSIEPRKMRGIIQMSGVPPDTSDVAMRGQLATITEEVGHHWLVPSDLEFNFAGSAVTMLDVKELTRLINLGQLEFDRPLLFGRKDGDARMIHWSSFFLGDGSALEGNNYLRRDDEGGLERWAQDPYEGPEIAPTGLPSLKLAAGYNDLDLLIMGVKVRSEAYDESRGSFRWLEPLLTTPFTYHIGVFVAFGRSDYFYFGFYDDHRHLAVERTSGPAVDRFWVDLGADYHPLAHDLNGVALRVIRRGNQYHFQARFDEAPLAPDSLLDDDGYRTLHTRNTADRPQAVGLIVKRRDHPHLAEGAFSGFAIQDSSGSRTIISTGTVPASVRPGTPYSSLPDDELRVENPTGKAVFRTDPASNRLFITAPYSVFRSAEEELDHDTRFDHTSAVDEAPKAIIRAPDGDFTFATSCKVSRTIFRPWTGGGANGKTMWGKVRSLSALRVMLPEDIIQRQQEDHNTCAYGMAFILAARDRNSVTDDMIERLDVTRRYWTEAFPAITAGRRQADTTLNYRWKLAGVTPMFAHANGWSSPQYHKTIRLADVDGDGRAELIARGARGLVTYKWIGSDWVFEGSSPSILTDAAGWKRPQYYETIRLADVDGDERDELIVRGSRGIVTYRWNGSEWSHLDTAPILTDAQGWNHPQYYRTIRMANVTGPEADGRQQAELIARGANGVVTFRWNGRTWSSIGPPASVLANTGGWDNAHYYETIRLADVDGDGKAELIVRGSQGVVTYHWDGEWVHQDTAGILTNTRDWQYPQYYETIRLANVTGPDSDGSRRAELVARGRRGVGTHRWNGATWEHIGAPLTTFSDADLWDRRQYYDTIRLADIDGDGKVELVARGPKGIVAYKWMCEWLYRGTAPILTDEQGWNEAHFYETIRFADIDGDGKEELVARGWDSVWVFQTE